MKKFLRLSGISALVLALGIGLSVAKPTAKSSGAWLGVYTQTVNDELAEGFKLKATSGAIINEIVDNSPADEAGLREDDIVIAVDGEKVATSDELIDMIRAHKSGDNVTIKVLRDGAEKEFSVTLDDREDSPAPRMFSFKSPRATQTPGFQFFSDNSPDVYIGVGLTTLSDQLRNYFGVSNDEGVLVSSVEKDSPAEKAGVKAGDVIVKADNEVVADASDLRGVVGDKKDGEKVTLALVRDRKPMTLSIEVAENEHASMGHGNMRSFTLPDIGRIPTPNVPKMRGLWYGTDDNDKDAQDMRDQMKELRQQLDELREQLKELRNSKK